MVAPTVEQNITFHSLGMPLSIEVGSGMPNSLNAKRK